MLLLLDKISYAGLENGIAIGGQASAQGTNSVALGAGSVATEDNSVSVGNTTDQRKIVNMAAGDISTSSTDAINGSQLYAISKSVADRLGGGYRQCARCRYCPELQTEKWYLWQCWRCFSGSKQ